MTNVHVTFVVCPLCNRWVILEGHAHETEIHRIREIERRIRKVTRQTKETSE